MHECFSNLLGVKNISQKCNKPNTQLFVYSLEKNIRVFVVKDLKLQFLLPKLKILPEIYFPNHFVCG